MGLDKIRQEIDRIDEQIKELFLERMGLSREVIEEKLRTGGAVYAPERERDIISRRLDGVKEEYQLECQAFFKHIMGISRTYQYAKLTNRAEALKELPNGAGEVMLSFFCGRDNPEFSAALDALSLAGVKAVEIRLQEEAVGEYICRMRISGDFSQILSKAAVLQILEENKNSRIEK